MRVWGRGESRELKRIYTSPLIAMLIKPPRRACLKREVIESTHLRRGFLYELRNCVANIFKIFIHIMVAETNSA